MASFRGAPAAQPESVRQPGSIGLEMRLAPVRSEGGALSAALQPFERNPTGIDEETTTRLRLSGLRAVSVPTDALDQALGSLTPAGAVQQEWLGTLTFWSPIITGPVTDDPMTRLDSGDVNFGQGRFRLLARCWVVPDLTDAEDTGFAQAEMRLELVPQHVPANERRLQRLLTPSLNTPVAEGQILQRLRLTCDLKPEHALVLVPVAPGEWTPAPATDAVPGESDRTVGPDPHIDEPDIQTPAESAGPGSRAPTLPPVRRPPGPLSPAAATLGEQLLRSPGSVESRESGSDGVRVHPERSVVVVLIAHTPARYKLVP